MIMFEFLLIPLIALLCLFLYALSALNILPEYERGVVFRLGRLLPEAKGPGVVFAFWPLDRIVRVSLRTVTLDVPPQDIITRDNVTVSVNAVVYFRVIDPRLAIVEVENFLYATSQLAQTTLRSVLGEVELDELLSEREKLNERLQDILDRQTDRWGIKVSLVEIKGVDLPQEMRRAMSKQAEAEREKRAKVIHAEGEYQAAEKLVKAAHAIAAEPVAIQLRYLQTLTEIGVEQNTTVVFPIPLQMLEGFSNLLGREKVELPLARLGEPVTVARKESYEQQNQGTF
jgi:regulator of protease activity HflC (stomatin/prohibitin superfamily)